MKQYTLTLSSSELEIIIACLGKQPYEVVNPVILAIMKQVQNKESGVADNVN